MKKLLWILPLLLLFSCNDYRASRAPADWIYVATTGNDGTGDGSSGAPYLTLGHAVSQASAGDTVFVKAGSYTISTQVAVGTGISLYTNEAVTLTAGAALNPMFLYSSASENTNGNQSISGFTFDGDLTAEMGIRIYARGNVSIHDCNFIDFVTSAVRFNGLVSGAADGSPTTHATGNKIYNCTFTNCSGEWFEDPYYFASGAVGMGGQSGMLFYNNTIDGITGSRNGYGIKYDDGGYNRGIKIYDNTITIAAKTHSGNQWSFAIEFWNQEGGIEVYDNRLQGAVDFGGAFSNDIGGYGFAEKIYNNTFAWDGFQTYGQSGITIESDVTGGVYIYGNRFDFYSGPIAFTQISGPLDICDSIFIYYNIMNETATTTGNYSGTAIAWSGSSAGATYDDIYIWNNTINNTTYIGKAGIRNEASDITLTDIYIQNNIITKTYNAVQFENHTITGFHVTNNNLYATSNDTVRLVGSTVTGAVYGGNITSSPAFQTNSLRLSSTSPAINAGTPVGLTTDFAGHRIPQQDTVDIGAYEYGNYLFRTPSGHLLRNANGKFMITH